MTRARGEVREHLSARTSAAGAGQRCSTNQSRAGPLAPALNRFALEAGVVMYYPPELTEGRRTAGLQGRYTVEQGFRALLRDTGLSADREDGGVYTLTDAGAGAGVGARLERVTVEGEEDPRRDLY